MIKSPLSLLLNTKPAADPFPSPWSSQPSLQLPSSDFPAASATPALLFQESHGWGALWQSRAVQMLLLLCSPWVCTCISLPGCASAVGEERIPSPSSEGSAWTQAPCPCANITCKNGVSSRNSCPAPPQFSSLTTPATLSLLFAINSAGPGEIGSFHPPLHSPLSLPAAVPSSLPWPCAADPVTEMK